MAGNVLFDSNYELCYVNTIKWSDILTGRGVSLEPTYRLSDPSQPVRQCKYLIVTVVHTEVTSWTVIFGIFWTQ